MGPQFGSAITKLVYFFVGVDDGEFQVSCWTVMFQFISSQRWQRNTWKLLVRLCDAIHTITIIFHISISCLFFFSSSSSCFCNVISPLFAMSLYFLSVFDLDYLFILIVCYGHSKTLLYVLSSICAALPFFIAFHKVVTNFCLVIDINADDMRSIK